MRFTERHALALAFALAASATHAVITDVAGIALGVDEAFGVDADAAVAATAAIAQLRGATAGVAGAAHLQGARSRTGREDRRDRDKKSQHGVQTVHSPIVPITRRIANGARAHVPPADDVIQCVAPRRTSPSMWRFVAS